MHSIRIEVAPGFRSTGRTRDPAARRLEPGAPGERHAAWTRFVILLRRGRTTAVDGGSTEATRTPRHDELRPPFC